MGFNRMNTSGKHSELRLVVHELRASQSTTLAGVPASAGQIPQKRLTRHPMNGFSMVEMLVVVSIIIVTTAMALPRVFTAVQYRALQNTLLSSAGAIQLARFQAVSTGVPYEITFSSTNSTYQLLACSNCTGNIYDPNSTYTFGTAPAPYNLPIPFAAADGPTLGASQSFYFRPGGAVQTTWGTTNCTTNPPPTSMQLVFSYQGVSKTLTVGCYGNVTVPQ